MGRGDGEGPMGKPREEMFAMDIPELKPEVEKQVDLLIDMCGMSHKKKKEEVNECGDENEVKNVPTQDAEEELSRVHADISGFVDPDDESDEYPPGPEDEFNNMVGGDNMMTMGEKLEYTLKEEEYKVFFKSMLDKEGLSSIKDLSAEKKKSFFNKVDAAWKAKGEKPEKLEEDVTAGIAPLAAMGIVLGYHFYHVRKQKKALKEKCKSIESSSGRKRCVIKLEIEALKKQQADIKKSISQCSNPKFKPKKQARCKTVITNLVNEYNNRIRKQQDKLKSI